MKYLINLILFISSFTCYAESIFDADNAFINGDYSKAYKIYNKYIDSSYAKMVLGYMHANGQGTDLDYELAFKYMEEAAIGGEPEAKINLAVLYANGLGVDKDIQKASIWLKQDMPNGWDGYSKYYLNSLYSGKTLILIQPRLRVLNKFSNSGGGYQPSNEDNKANVKEPPKIDYTESKKQCADLGFKTGTEKFGKCVLELTK